MLRSMHSWLARVSFVWEGNVHLSGRCLHHEVSEVFEEEGGARLQAISKAAVEIIANNGNTTNNGLRPNLSAACCTTDVMRNASPSSSAHVMKRKKRELTE